MTQTQEPPPFPNHQFDFADVVFVLPLQANGFVVGILYQDSHWYYQLAFAVPNNRWWHENQLAFAAPDDCLVNVCLADGSIPFPNPDPSNANNLL